MSAVRHGLLQAKGLETESSGVDRIIAAQVQATADEVAAMRQDVIDDKAIVEADKATVAADKATVAADKATVAGYKNDAQAAAGLRVGVARTSLSGLNALAGPFTEGASGAVTTGVDAGIYSYTSSVWTKVSDLPEASAAASATAAAASAVTSAVGVSETGTDGADHTTANYGATAADTATEAALVVGPNVITTSGGKLDSFSVRVSASGTGKILVVDRNNNKIIKSIAVTVASGVNTFTAGVSGFPVVVVPKNCSLFYEQVTGGGVRYVTGSGSKASFAKGAAVGDTVTLTMVVHTVAVAWSITGPAASARRRIAQLEYSGLLGALPSVWKGFFNCAQGGGTIIPDLTGGAPIDLSAASNFTWRRGHVSTASGYFRSPTTWSSVKTLLIACRTLDTESNYLFAAPSGQSGTLLANACNTSNATNVRVCNGFGVHPMWRRNDTNGSAAYEVNGGGWCIYVLEFATPLTGSLIFGNAANLAAGVSYGGFCGIGWSDGTVTDDEITRTWRALSADRAQDGIYLASVDCPEIVDPFLCMGESIMEGPANISGLTADQQAYRFTDTLSYARNFTSFPTDYATYPFGEMRLGVNHAAPEQVGLAKFAMTHQMARALEECAGNGRRRIFINLAQGSTFCGPSGTSGVVANRSFHPAELATAGLFSTLTLRHFYKIEQQLRLAGIGMSQPALLRAIGINDANKGTAYVPDAATVLAWIEAFTTALKTYTAIVPYRDVVIPPHNNQTGRTSDQILARTSFRTAVEDYIAVDPTIRKKVSPDTWPVNTSPADDPHHTPAGTVQGGNDLAAQFISGGRSIIPTSYRTTVPA